MPAFAAVDVSIRVDPPPGVNDDEWLAALGEWWARGDRVLLDSDGTPVGFVIAVETSFVLRLRVDRACLDRLADRAGRPRISYVQEDDVNAGSPGSPIAWQRLHLNRW